VIAVATAEPLSTWKTLVRARATAEQEEVGALADPSKDHHLKDAQERINKAMTRSAGGNFGRGLVSWFTGADQEFCWTNLHEADVHLVYVRRVEAVIDEIPDLKNRVRLEFPKRSDAYGQELLAELDLAKSQLPTSTTEAAGRETVAHVKHVLYERSHIDYQSKRSFRNIIVGLILAVTSFAVMLAVPGVGLSGWIAGLLEPLGWSSEEAFTTVWRVELVGALGGLLAGAAAIQRLQGLSGRYGLPFFLAVLKLPMGAIMGLIGAILVQSNDFWIEPASDRVSFYALVLLFGASQQLITRLIDAKAAEVADKANPATENPKTNGS
jgi:hypothetical protein